MSFHRIKAQAQPPHREENEYQTELAAYSVLYRFLQRAHLHVYECLSEQNQHQRIKVPFQPPQPWSVHAVNAEG